MKNSERLKHLADIFISTVDKRSTDGEQSVALCNYMDVYYNARITDKIEFMAATATPDQVRQFTLRSGDILLTKDSETADDIAVSTLVPEDLPGVVCGYHLALVRANQPRVEPSYLFWTLRSDTVRRQFIAAATGVTRFGLRSEAIGDAIIPMRPLAEQRAIANYLDTETSRIDALIAKKQHMMGLAVERLRTLITVLTEGGPSVQIRRLISLRTSGPRGWADLVTETGAPFIRSANLQRGSIEIKTDNLAYVTPPMTEEARRSAVRDGDVLVGITGANAGWVGCVHSDLAGGFVSQHVAILRPASVEPQWLAYSLFSQRAQDQLLGSQYGGTKQQLGLDDLAELRIACPDREEQQRRTRVMTSAYAATKKVVALLECQIELHRERRQALITAVVTGELKIPVPEAVA